MASANLVRGDRIRADDARAEAAHRTGVPEGQRR